MRYAAVLVLVMACHRPAEQAVPPPRTPAVAHEDAVPELQCSAPGQPSTLRGVDPQQGGYLVVEDDSALERWRSDMAHGTTAVARDVAAREMTAMSAAFGDLRPELQKCMVAGDGAHPELQYELRMGLLENSVATVITGVSLQRIDGATDRGEPIFGTTPAEACVRDLLRRLVLPPAAGGIGESVTIVRQDFCMPTAAIAMYGTRSYVEAYKTWWRAHRDRICPTGLSDLDGYDRDHGKDPWHQPYGMRCDANGFEVISGGPDRRIGTGDDLSSHR